MMTKETFWALRGAYQWGISHKIKKPTPRDYENNVRIQTTAQRRTDLAGRPWEVQIIGSNGEKCGWAYSNGWSEERRQS